jgi:hypothetical protein
MPSYLIFDSGTSIIGVNQSKTNDATANSRRRRRMKCEGGVCPTTTTDEPALDEEDQAALDE